MRPIASAALLACLLACLLAGLAAPARAETAGDRHTAWRACLDEAFALRAALSGPGLAADAALRECRAAETAYLAALATSPLLDDEDVTRARPQLLARARDRLVSGRTREL